MGTFSKSGQTGGAVRSPETTKSLVRHSDAVGVKAPAGASQTSLVLPFSVFQLR